MTKNDSCWNNFNSWINIWGEKQLNITHMTSYNSLGLCGYIGPQTRRNKKKINENVRKE